MTIQATARPGRQAVAPFRAPGLLGLLLALGLSAAGAAMTPPDTLVVGKSQDPQNLDPAFTQDNNDWTVTYPCYQRLMRYKVEKGVGTTNMEGDLAERYQVSKDNLVWEFKLRSGQKFDDGSPVNAEAVKASFERLMKVAQGPSENFPSDMKISVVDPMTVRFTLTKVYAPFLSALATNAGSIINPKALALPDAGEDGKVFFSRNTAGSGAFRLTGWLKGQSLTLEPNPHFAGKKPVLKKMVVRIIGEASSRRLQLESGDVDIAEALPQDQLAALRTRPGVQVAEFPSLGVTYLYLNNKKAPLDNVQVRQAISYAVDYDGIIKNIMVGHAKQMRGPIPEGLWGYDPTLMQYKLDLPKAKALLDQANPSRKALTFLYSGRDPSWEPIGLSLQANLTNLGFTIKMESMANATMRDRINKGDYDISIGNWSPDYGDPFEFMNSWFETSRYGLAGNRSFYTNPDVNQMVMKAATLSDQKQRTEIYQKAQKIVVNEAAYVYLYQKNYVVGVRSAVKGFVFNPMLEQIFNVDSITKE